MRTKILCLLFTLTILLPTSSVIGLTDAADSPYSHLVEIVPMEHGYIRSNGTVEPASLPIERTGNYYLLKDDIVNYTIEIQSSNVIFDGNGHTLSLPQESYTTMPDKYGPALIQITNNSNVVIQNTEFTTYYTGISAANSSRITILVNNFKSGRYSIELRSCINSDIIGNSLTENSAIGLFAYKSAYLNIAYNNISRNQNGCNFVQLSYSNITRNNIIDNFIVKTLGNAIFALSIDNNRFFENNLINNAEAIAITGSYNTSVNNLIYQNYFHDNHLDILNTGGDADSATNESPLGSPANTSYQPQLYTAPSENPTSPDANNTLDLQTIALVSGSAIIVTLLVAGSWQYRRKHTRKQ